VSPDDVRAHLRRLSALGGGALVQRRAAARLLGGLPESSATALLVHLLALSRQRWEPALKLLPAFLHALEEDGDAIPHLELLQRVAALHEQAEVEQLFAVGEPTRAYDSNAAKRADSKLSSLPLGVMRSRARLTRNVDELERLAVVSNPLVVREVLKNPRLTEPQVVRIAARRPARPEPLVEIWRSKWAVLPAVRRALAFNPYLPPEVGAKVVPLLTRADLVELQTDATVHAGLREQAARLLTVTAS
jgi:hypothetical protein